MNSLDKHSAIKRQIADATMDIFLELVLKIARISVSASQEPFSIILGIRKSDVDDPSGARDSYDCASSERDPLHIKVWTHRRLYRAEEKAE